MNGEIKNIYEKILELNIQINSCLKDFPADNFDEFNENFQGLIDQKGEFIQKLIDCKENNEEELKKLAETDLKEISNQINELERENIELLQEKKVFLSGEINRTNRASKALAGYKFKKETEPRLFDETD